MGPVKRERRTENGPGGERVPYVEARAAAAVLRILRDSGGTGVPKKKLRRALHEVSRQAQGPSLDRLLRRAVRDVRELGFRVEEPEQTRLVLVAQAERWLELPPELAALRRRVREFIGLYEDEEETLRHIAARMKQHVRDHVEFWYGSQPTPFQGIPYRWEGQGRPRLLVHTQQRARAFFVDAIFGLRVVKTGVTPVKGPVGPPLVEEEPLGSPVDPRAPRHKGRASAARTVLDAIRVAGLVRERALDSNDGLYRCLDAKTVAAALRLREQEVVNKAEAVYQVDPQILFDDETKTFSVPSDDVGTWAPMDGAGALEARLDLSAVLSLGAAAQQLGGDFNFQELGTYRERLDHFLDKANVEDDACLCAVEVVTAMQRSSPLQVALLHHRLTRRLLPTEICLHRWRWHVSGLLDDTEIAPPGLLLADIVPADL